MPHADLGDVTLNYRDRGTGAPLVLVHGLGMNMSLWDSLLPLLPAGLRVVEYDLRGHGSSSLPEGTGSMGALVRDAERLLDHLNIRDAMMLGLGLGGMVAQGLAVKRLDQIRALVLSGTAAKLGTPGIWKSRAEAAAGGGMEAVADATLKRWFPPKAQDSNAARVAREMLLNTRPEGYAAGCGAISGTDFYTPTSGLRLPVLGLCGTEDRATPPDLVRETAELVPGADMALIRRAGHLPCLDQPEEFAALLNRFLSATGHADGLGVPPKLT
jgi:3-oxoadipate enol-lactonase